MPNAVVERNSVFMRNNRVKNMTDFLKGYKLGVKEGKNDALVELQKTNTNDELPSNDVLKKIIQKALECKNHIEQTHSLYINEYQVICDYVVKNWEKEK